MNEFLQSPNLLRTIISQSEASNAAASELVTDLNEEQLNWKPGTDKWSIAQCLDHLAVSSSKFDQYFESALGWARSKWPVISPPAYRPTRMGAWLIKQIEPVTGRNLPAPKVFRPSSSDIQGALQKFLDQQETFLNFVRGADGVDFNKTRLRSPVTPFMRYSLADAFVITVVHTRRHLGQARKVLETPGLPN